MRRSVAALGRRTRLSHVLHHDVASGKTADQERSLIANHGAEPVFLLESKSRSAGTGFLAKPEIDAAHYLSLLVKVFERRLHAAVQQHPAVDFDALLLRRVF